VVVLTQKKYPIIIGGFYRSGTSLLRRLLDAHSHIHCAPEIKFFKDLGGDYLDDPLAHIRLFSTLPSLGLNSGEILDIFGSAFIRAHELAARKAGKERWADKNPENSLYLEQWRSLLPEGFIFVHVVRNPLDVLASLLEVGFSKTVPVIFEEKVKLLKFFVDAGSRYEALYPETSIRLQYEELVMNPQATLKSLFNFIGEVYEIDVLNSYNNHYRLMGIEDPKVAETEGIHSLSVGRWHKDLAPEQVEIARNVLGNSFSHNTIKVSD
jgi:hypothetical protein